MSEDPIVKCRWCVMTFMKRVPQVPSTQFKGSGFASNDKRQYNEQWGDVRECL